MCSCKTSKKDYYSCDQCKKKKKKEDPYCSELVLPIIFHTHKQTLWTQPAGILSSRRICIFSSSYSFFVAVNTQHFWYLFHLFNPSIYLFTYFHPSHPVLCGCVSSIWQVYYSCPAIGQAQTAARHQANRLHPLHHSWMCRNAMARWKNDAEISMEEY